MVGFLLRMCYLLSGLTPMAFGLFCRDAESLWFLVSGALIALGIVIAGMLFLLFCLWGIEKKFGPSAGVLKPVSVVRFRYGLPAYMIAYVLPFFLTTGGTWMLIGSAALLIVLFSLRTSALGYNPIADMFGYGFYEVGVRAPNDGVITVFVLSKKSPQSLIKGYHFVSFSDDFQVAF
nr:MAG TPA: hypothetical protein [Bacteriophage sp.]